MYQGNSKGLSYMAGFFMLIAFAIAGIMLAALLSGQVWTSMTGKALSAWQNNALGPEDSNALRVIQVITALFGFLLPAIVAATMLDYKPMQLLGFSTNIRAKQTGLTIIIILVAMLISVFALTYLNRTIPIPDGWKIRADKLENAYNQQVQVILNLDSPFDYIIALVVMAFLPALCEEALFRGGLQNFLSRSTGKPWLSIAIVSVLFSAFHFSFYGFLPRLFLGAVLGIIYQYSGKLWLSILAHFINNAFAITLLYVWIRQGKPMEQAITETNQNWWGILLLPLIFVLFNMLKNNSPDTENRIHPAD